MYIYIYIYIYIYKVRTRHRVVFFGGLTKWLRKGPLIRLVTLSGGKRS